VNIKSNINRIRREKTFARDWREYKPGRAKRMMKELLEEDLTNKDTSELNVIITTSYGKILEELCPYRAIRTARNSDLVSTTVEKIKKRRKRFMHEYNQCQNQERKEILACKIMIANKELKSAIKQERKRIINIKLQSPNPKSFWREINKLEGKIESKEEIALSLNGTTVNNPEILADTFCDFFANKVLLLSKNEPPYKWKRSADHYSFNEKDLEMALKSFRSKLSSGIDGIPMKLIKDISPAIAKETLLLFNSAAISGMPPDWKTSIVRPLHKKGSKLEVGNYRPISNLTSISKLYERMILNKLDDEYPNIEGSHQHGFRKDRSTVSALLELQDEVSSNMDSNLYTATYSIDMSAAFDLLRPRIFHQLNLGEAAMNTLMDFMSDRLFRVEVGKTLSKPTTLNVGCVQGSVLGPKLFGIYCNQLKNEIGNAHLVSYADDSYVTVAAENLADLKIKIEATLEKHQTYMETIGMVINKDKTELIVYNKKSSKQEEMVLGQTGVKSTSKIKALGVTITSDLNWNTHVQNQTNKTNRLISSIKFLGKWLKTEDLLKVITSKYYGTMYYAAPVWMAPTMSYQTLKQLNRQHYRALRAAYKDRKCEMSKETLNSLSGRATPRQWAKYIVASTTIKMFQNGTTPMSEKLRKRVYINDRFPGKGTFHDISRTKIGRQSLPNRLDFLREINFDWTNAKEPISKDKLRIALKKTFIETTT